MNIRKTGTRGTIFTYDDNISVYLINGNQKIVLCDTHLGPLSMEVIKQYLAADYPQKEILIFNSHSDWDHIWGNCAFAGAEIIAHETARTRMQELGPFELARLKNLHQGEIVLKYPSLTFSEHLALENEDIEFIYAPGHTIDSALCFDRKDSVLFVGDLVEYPIPYLDYYDLSVFCKTLDFIRDFPAKTKLSAHSGIVSNDLIKRNLEYIKEIKNNQSVPPEMIGSSTEVHQYNLNNRLLLKYEPSLRKQAGKSFAYQAYKSRFSDLGRVSTDSFKKALQDYLQTLNIQF